MYDVIILGAGPAGLSAAVYCKRANLDVIVIDNKLLGGNWNNYTEIENYLGMGKISTGDLIEKFSEHIIDLGIEVLEFAEITSVDLNNKIVTIDKRELHAKNIIIATGSKPRMLNVEGEDLYIGNGVHYCAICDGPMYKNKSVAVIGGGNSACEEALGLSKICNHVTLIECTDKLNAEQITIDKIKARNNIDILLNTKVKKINGTNRLTGLQLEDIEGNISDISLDGIFVYIGMSPNLPPLKEKPMVFTNDYGYIYVNEYMETPKPNIYAIGDITNKKYRQVVTAISDGAIAAIHIREGI